MSKHPTIPMFHRRLLLLTGVMAIVVLVLGTQLARLSLVQGAERREKADRRLLRHTMLPTYRGRILDRNGRELAVDRPGYAIAVDYEAITGAWSRKQARLRARREVGGTRWGEMTEEEKAKTAGSFMAEWDSAIDGLWTEVCLLGGIGVPELQRRLDRIVEEVQSQVDVRAARQLEGEIAQFGPGAAKRFRREPILEERSAHVVLPSVSDEVAFAFRAKADELPDVYEVEDARRREYPELTRTVRLDRDTLPRPLVSSPITIGVTGVADHILGTMRDVQAEDVARRPFWREDGVIDPGGYRSVDDTAGERGLERVFEDLLRGTRGEVHRRLDEDDETRRPPAPGVDLTLTLDIALQSRIQAILSDEVGLTTVQPFHKNTLLPAGWPLNSAVVVIEVESGEILAMVSTPTRAMGEAIRALDPARDAIDHPWVNRPAEAIYPPGSIIKPLVLVGAVTDGVHALEDSIECTGHYFPNVTQSARCWIYRDVWDFATHGELRAEAALAQSCNIFFYTLAERLGVGGMVGWLGRFGAGRHLDVGLLDEYVEDGERAVRGESAGHLFAADHPASVFDTISMGIGQGPGITWTPLHAANAFAMLARGGSWRDATLIADPPVARPTRPDLALDPVLVGAALAGLRGSVSPGGTGHHITYDDQVREDIFNAPGVTVWGKTGTAEAPPLRPQDTNGDGVIGLDDEPILHLDHAWFVGLVGPNDTERPMFAISVLVENGGSGGRVAGPVANQVIRALQHEGYLPQTPFTGSREDGT